MAGDHIEKAKKTATDFVVKKLNYPEEWVETTKTVVDFGIGLVTNKAKGTLKDAKSVAEAVKKQEAKWTPKVKTQPSKRKSTSTSAPSSTKKTPSHNAKSQNPSKSLDKEFKKHLNNPEFLHKSGRRSTSHQFKHKDGSSQEVISKNRTGANAQSANAQHNLNSKLKELQKAQKESVRDVKLEDGRVRYYSKERLADKPGPTRGNSYVVEHDPKTNRVKSWMESYDHHGKVTRVHPKTYNGQKLKAQHYPLTGKEKNYGK